MKHIRLIAFLLPLSLACANEKELFELLPDPEQTWEHYTEHYFPKIENRTKVLHLVTTRSTRGEVHCLSLLRENAEDGWINTLHFRTLSADGSEEIENLQVEISTPLTSSLKNFSYSVLKFTQAEPRASAVQGETTTFYFLDGYQRPLGRTTDPAEKSVPAQAISLFAALEEDAADGVLDDEAWEDRVWQAKKDLPQLPWVPTYSEFRGPDIIKKDLEIMKNWKLTHQVERLSMDGYKDSESINFRQELAEALAEVAPKEWKELMRSSGNMHNPKVLPIHAHLDEATRQTRSAGLVNQVLDPYGLEVTGLSAEKLSFATKTGGGLPDAMMYLEVGPKE